MRKAVIQALFMLVALVSTSTYGADRYWVGASGAAWNTTDSWSTSSGGSNGASIPGTSDTAIFDSGDTDNCTLTAAVSVTAINMKSGYTGTVDAAGNNITTSSTVDVTGGTLEIDSSSILAVTGVLTVDGGTLTSTDGTIDADSNVIMTAGTLTAPDGARFTVAGHWSTWAGGTFTHSSGTVTFDGTSTITTGGIGDGQDFYNVVLNGTSATQATNAIDIDNNFTITSGTWDTASFDMTVGGTSDTSGGTFITYSSPADSTDLTAPTLSSSSPSDGATGVDINAILS